MITLKAAILFIAALVLIFDRHPIIGVLLILAFLV